MADRYSFQSPFSRNDGDDPWFRVGDISVTTTVAVTAMGILMMFVAAAEGANGPVFRTLALDSRKVFDGQVWRLVTWPIPNEPDFWLFITVVFFFLLGQRLESVLGRRPFLYFLLLVTVVPAILATVTAEILDESLSNQTLRFLNLAVIAAFPVVFPRIQGFFGIPFWVFAVVIFGLDFLQLLQFRQFSLIVMLIAAGATALLTVRALGHAPEAEWIPVLPVPSAITTTGSATPRPARRKKSRNKAGLRSVQMPAATEAQIDALLDQVSDRGIDSLTKEQKAILKRHSEEMRRRRDDE